MYNAHDCMYIHTDRMYNLTEVEKETLGLPCTGLRNTGAALNTFISVIHILIQPSPAPVF